MAGSRPSLLILPDEKENATDGLRSFLKGTKGKRRKSMAVSGLRANAADRADSPKRPALPSPDQPNKPETRSSPPAYTWEEDNTSPTSSLVKGFSSMGVSKAPTKPAAAVVPPPLGLKLCEVKATNTPQDAYGHPNRPTSLKIY